MTGSPTTTLLRLRDSRIKISWSESPVLWLVWAAWLSEAERAELWGDSFQVWEAAVRAAAEDTAGVCLTWRGEPILACFHASSPGVTESSGAVWGTALPYLVSVDTPEGEEDVPGFVTSVRLSADELRRGVREIDPRAPFDGEPCCACSAALRL